MMTSLRVTLIFRQMQRPFILWLVLWMALFAPAVCQYHGLLVREHTALHHQAALGQGSAVASDPFDYLCGMSLQAQSLTPASQTAGSTISGLVGHHPLSGDTLMLISLLVLALPAALQIHLHREMSSPNLHHDHHPFQCSQLVLTPPPR